MNSKHFIVLFFNLAMLAVSHAIYDLGTGALTVTLASATGTAAGASTFATPLAVLGVLKLGAAAALALGYIAYDGGYGYGGHGGYDDYDYGYGGGHGGHGFGKGIGFGFGKGIGGHHKRSAESPAGFEGVTVPTQDGIFELISAMDTHGCGKQLICELEAKNDESLEADERLMLQLFSKKQKKTVNPYSPKSEYILAAELGMASKDQVICRHRFASCPYTAEEMMQALRNSHI